MSIKKQINKKIIASFIGSTVFSEDKQAKNLYGQSCYGEPGLGRIQYSLAEALYLIETKKLNVSDYRKKKLTYNGFMRKAMRIDPNFSIKYAVYKDMRSRGYIVKSALKFGADFMVYNRGIKPGQDHAKWVLFPVHESEVFSWYEYASKNRVAHSTRKKLLIGIVDDRNGVVYYEVTWKKP